MSRIFLRRELEGVANFWQIYRRDGVTLGFTSHDRDLWFDGILHRAAPGMIPSAIRKSAGLDDDSAEVEGVLAHDSIAEIDLLAGRFDEARIAIGAVDWENGEHAALFHGSLGSVSAHSGRFTAELRSAKSLLQRDYVPRTSPLCRARFCGPGCTLSIARHSHTATLLSADPEQSRVSLDIGDHTAYRHGELRWLDGPATGEVFQIVSAEADSVTIDPPISSELKPGLRARLREGCDHTLAICNARFSNAINFQGEPFLPGNDLLARFPNAQ